MSHFAILDNNFDENGIDKKGQAWVFDEPKAFVTLRKGESYERVFEVLNTEQRAGNYLVGAMSYELGSLIEPAFASHLDQYDDLLLIFGVFKNRKEMSQLELDEYLQAKCGLHHPFITRVKKGINEKTYLEALSRIRAYLESGDSYQVNYTFPTYFDVGGCLTWLYQDLRQAQPVKYGAYLHFPEVSILSRSPELFFQKRGECLETHPMKGTAKRDNLNPEHDENLRKSLQIDPKQRAENLMITDLLRNDLSRIAKKNSVNVRELFSVESFPTVHQMISKIACKVEKEITLLEILRALYPCGSITGAPKIRTSEIIKELEAKPRGFYTGAIGFLSPENDMTFSVPIRTLCVDAKRHAVLSIGSGVVYDSVGKAEYDECLLKGRFLFDHQPRFHLIESFFAEKGHGRNQALHLERMEKSARELNFVMKRSEIEDALNLQINTLIEPSKIRVELDKDGGFRLEAVSLGEVNLQEARVKISKTLVNGHNPVYRFKTSNRGLYNREFTHARAEGFVDVLFFNRDGFLTEGAIHNVFLKLQGDWITPKLEAGCLAGIGRALWLKKTSAKEAFISRKDFNLATEVWLVSSTRGAFKVEIFQD